MANIVKNESKAYGYNYASLSDIAKQGFDIPKMKTDTDQNGDEYVYYFDGSEWIRGAKVVIPNIKGMNEAQLYGSALTYARRYTVQMADSLVCDDDKKLETSEEEKASEKQVGFIKKLYSPEEVTKILDYYKIEDLTDLSKNVASQYINDRYEK